MGLSPKAVAVEPALLKWGRLTIGYDEEEAAKKIGVKIEKLISWEEGEDKPRLRQLEEIARVYKRPIPVFFLNTPPEDPPLPKDFRRLPGPEKPLSSDTRLAIRRAAWITRTAADLSNELGLPGKKGFRAFTVEEDPETAADFVRKELGVDIEEQRSWRDEIEAVKKWRGLLENKGVLTLQFKMPMEETRGFSQIGSEINTVVINAEDSYTGRVFSLLHEFCHILLKDPGLCNWEGPFTTNAALEKVEVYCNHFAAACLVPKDELLNLDEAKRGIKQKKWTDENLKQIASVFKVSREVILRRLLEFGLASKNLYEKKRSEWAEELKKTKGKKRKSQWGPPPDVKCIWEKGALFTSLVLMGAKEEYITLSDVAEYLNIKLKYIPGLEREVFKSVVK